MSLASRQLETSRPIFFSGNFHDSNTHKIFIDCHCALGLISREPDTGADAMLRKLDDLERQRVRILVAENADGDNIYR